MHRVNRPRLRISKSPSQKKSGMASDFEFYGFVFLLIACALLTIRMLVDPAIVRRPLLEPNLTIGGLSFIGVSLLIFLLANVITAIQVKAQTKALILVLVTRC